MRLHCPLCGTPFDFEPALDRLDVFSASTLVARWVNTSIHHTCPDPMQDGPPTCGVQRDDGLACNRDRGHGGQHGHAGIFWANADSVSPPLLGGGSG